jgi:signal transduction histidine kinase
MRLATRLGITHGALVALLVVLLVVTLGGLLSMLGVITLISDQRLSTLDAEEAGGVPIPIRGDESALEQVFLNILLNAAQSLGTAGSASVAVTTGSGRACVVVRDSGAGIAPEWLERVFDPFVTTRADGTGLGLPIARGIVAAHGGTIGIASAPGQGTKVSIELPMTGGA